MLLTLGLSMVIGLLLGLLGGGGSILTVPMLVYLLKQDPKVAILTSFVVVGISSIMALLPHARRGSVCWKSGLFFGLTGMAGAFGGGRLAGELSGDLLMTLFGTVCLLTGVLMIRKHPHQLLAQTTIPPLSACPLRVPYLRVLFDGFFVGAVTGMVGVGGGFLIVPALTLLVGFPIKGAVGTSLMVIAMNALAGLAGYSQHVSLDLNLTGIVAAGSITGSGIGALLSAYIKPTLLRRVFGLMVILIALYTLSQSTTAQLMSTLDSWVINPHTPAQALESLLAIGVVLLIGRWIHKSDIIVLTPVKPEHDG